MRIPLRSTLMHGLDVRQDKMIVIIFILLFYAVLAVFLAGTGFAKSSRIRIISAVCALLWAGVMFFAANTVQTFNINIWYSTAASNLLGASIQALEEGRDQEVIHEFQHMRESLITTYEHRGNFRALAITAASNLERDQAEQDSDGNAEKPPGVEREP